MHLPFTHTSSHRTHHTSFTFTLVVSIHEQFPQEASVVFLQVDGEWQDLHENESESHFISVPRFQSRKPVVCEISSNSNSVQIPFRNTTDVRTASVFSERRNTWSPSIYIFYISRTHVYHRNEEYIRTSAPLSSMHLYCRRGDLHLYRRRTSIDVCKSWRHLHLYRGAWTVSKCVRRLEGIQVRMQRFKSTIEVH